MASPNDGALTILVVENEPLILMDIEDFLTDAGYRVLTADDAQTALAHLDQNPSSIDLLLTDFEYRGINHRSYGSLDVLSALHEAGSTLPVILMTGSILEFEAEKQVQGCLARVSLLRKPFFKRNLQEMIESVLGLSGVDRLDVVSTLASPSEPPALAAG